MSEVATGKGQGSDDRLVTISRIWDEARPLLLLGPCRGCECLRGLLAELQLSLDELPPGRRQAELLETIASVKSPTELHACLGCEPCTPGDLLAEFYRSAAPPDVAAAGAACGGGECDGCAGDPATAARPEGA